MEENEIMEEITEQSTETEPIYGNIVFSDGTSLEVEVNATTFIVDDKPDIPEYTENVSAPGMDGQGTRNIPHARLQECYSPDGRFWFTYVALTDDEVFRRKVSADIDYIAMMTDVELEE